jgi:RHS repeat-associated protein
LKADRLKDALGSTVALVDSSGNMQTSYTYDPYGGTSVTGTTNGNEFQYTGLENDGNGLYFYPNRYFSSVLGRFVNEDPAGNGINFYAYADNDPIDFSDPFGLWPWGSAAPATSPGTNGGFQLIQGGKAASRFLPRGAGGWVAAGALAAADAWLGYELYQTVDAINGENAAYDEELQAIADLNTALLAHPRPLPLAGRYTNRQADYEDYKKRCDEPAPPGLGACAKRIWLLQRKTDCRDLRWRWDEKYDRGRHANDIANLNRGIENDQEWIDKNCK